MDDVIARCTKLGVVTDEAFMIWLWGDQETVAHLARLRSDVAYFDELMAETAQELAEMKARADPREQRDYEGLKEWYDRSQLSLHLEPEVNHNDSIEKDIEDLRKLMARL
jgi:hypothetical protein